MSSNCGCPPVPCGVPPCTPVNFCTPENFGLAYPSLVGPVGPPGGPGTFFANYGAVRILNATAFTDGYIGYVLGYATAGDGGQGYFQYIAASTEADNDGTVLRPNNGVGRWIRVYGGAVNIQWFGARGNGSADDTTSIQNAIDYTQEISGALYIPSLDFRITAMLVIEKRMTLFGAGWGSRLVVDSGVAGTVDALRLSPSTSVGDANNGFILQNFAIVAESGTPGRHAISVDITTLPCYNCQFNGLYLGALGSRGFVTLPNGTPLIDGFFTSTIQNCFIYNGIYLDKAGDSIRIQSNTITGNNIGVYADIVYDSGDVLNTGHNLDIQNNNITCKGGTLLVKNAWAGRFIGNNCEIPNYSGLTNNCMVNIDGTGALNKTNNFLIQNNFIGVPVNVDGIRINYARRTTVMSNYVGEPGGTGYSYRVTSNSEDATIIFDCPSGDSLKSSQLADAGVRTLWLRGFAGNLESGNDIAVLGANRYAGQDTAGTKIPVLLVEQADNTVKVGPTVALTTNGHLRFYAQAVERARIDPGGEFLINETTPTGGTTKLTIDGDIAFNNATTDTVATAGGASALPATPEGYLVFKLDGTLFKMPYYVA